MVAAVLLSASSAFAAPGVNLCWTNCLSEGGTGVAQNRTSACASNFGQQGLTGSFVLGAPVNGIVGVEIILDLISATSPIPAWWAYEDGGCRLGSLSMNAVVNGSNANCFDWSGGNGAGGLAAYNTDGSIAPENQAAHRRVLGGFAVAPQFAANLPADQEFFAFNLIINNLLTTSCTGCLDPVCIVFNSINVAPPPESGPATFIGTPTTPGSNVATWQGGTGANCAAVPTRNATWGHVKALYH